MGTFSVSELFDLMIIHMNERIHTLHYSHNKSYITVMCNTTQHYKRKMFTRTDYNPTTYTRAI